jgi:hypothetical protein
MRPPAGEPNRTRLNAEPSRRVSTEFLDDGDLERLTGYVRTAKQIDWLQKQRIPYRLNSRGKLVVRRNMVEKPAPAFELGPVR